MARKQHFHQYEKFTWPKGSIYYKCMQDGCSHYLPMADLVIGRESLCWGGCNRLVVITKEMVQKEVKKPMCDGCRAERQANKEALSAI
jgi:hypothetical protein